MTIHFHGSPIWGDKGRIARIAHRGSGAFVSFERPDQIKLAFDVADTVCIDNGAFSKWKSGKVQDWREFYFNFLPDWFDNPKLRFFVIPDDITGSAEDNDKLISQLPSDLKSKAAPVWHMHEPISRLISLCEKWYWVCMGSSGEFATVRSAKWKQRISEAFSAVKESQVDVRLHGLRMLDGRVLGNYPLNSADSTNLACNVPKYLAINKVVTIEACRRSIHKDKWIDTDDVKQAVDQCLSKGGSKSDILAERCAILKNCIESVKPPKISEWNSTNC